MKELVLIDDDPAFTFAAELLIRTVCPAYQLVVFHSSGQTLDYLTYHRPKLIFMDINMPELNGFDVLEKLEDAGIGKNIFVLSSTIDALEIKKAKSYGVVHGFLSKPLTKATLESVLNWAKEAANLVLIFKLYQLFVNKS